MLTSFELDSWAAEDVKRLVENKKRMKKAIEYIKNINANGAWLLKLQEEGIHTDTKETIEKFEKHLDLIDSHLKRIGGNYFVRYLENKDMQ